MTELVTVTVDSLQKFLDSVDGEHGDDQACLWFRGAGDSAYKLSPTIFRHKEIRDESSLFEYENKLIIRFKERSVPYLKNRISDAWENLFLMQHYGMPTRLLDWTENPLLALFFALSSAAQDEDGAYKTDVAVWVLCPAKWNQSVLSHLSYRGGALSTVDPLIKSYTPESDSKHMNEKPVAMLGIHNSPRIVAQRGSFCIFGKSLMPMDEIYSAGTFEENTLRKILIPKESIANLLKKLLWMGVTDAVIYPDLEGLARETKRQFGFKV